MAAACCWLPVPKLVLGSSPGLVFVHFPGDAPKVMEIASGHQEGREEGAITAVFEAWTPTTSTGSTCGPSPSSLPIPHPHCSLSLFLPQSPSQPLTSLPSNLPSQVPCSQVPHPLNLTSSILPSRVLVPSLGCDTRLGVTRGCVGLQGGTAHRDSHLPHFPRSCGRVQHSRLHQTQEKQSEAQPAAEQPLCAAPRRLIHPATRQRRRAQGLRAEPQADSTQGSGFLFLFSSFSQTGPWPLAAPGAVLRVGWARGAGAVPGPPAPARNIIPCPVPSRITPKVSCGQTRALLTGSSVPL